MVLASILGVGITPYGAFPEKNILDLVLEAGLQAMSESGLGPDEIDAFYFPVLMLKGHVLRGAWLSGREFWPLKAGYINGCWLGVEKMTHASTSEVTTILSRAGNREFETKQGATFPSITMEEVLTFERMVAEPLTVYDCSPASDGAAAVVLSVPQLVSDRRRLQVDIIGSGQASGYSELFQNKDITSFRATRLAAAQAYAMAGIKAADVDFAEVHDCFTIAEIIATEDLGFFPAGHGGTAALEGRTRIEGKSPVNPSGGLKAKGHPIGATGVGQMVEAVVQLREKAGARQVKNARIGLTHNLGGSGGTCTVHVLKRRDG